MPIKSGKHENKLKEIEKHCFGSSKKNFCPDSDTKIEPWFWFPIPKPGFGRTLEISSSKFSSTQLDFFCKFSI